MENSKITPSLIENTSMQLNYINGVPTSYYITPNEGYMLHDKLYDQAEYDEETMSETGNIIKGYRRSTASCSADYDFTANPREFYII